MERIKRRAKKKSQTSASSLEGWWSRKYNRPITSPLFQNLTEPGLLGIFYEDMHSRRADIEAELEEASIEDIPDLRRRLRIVDSVLNDTDPDDLMSRTGDPQIDKWLDELDAGQTPDLTEGMDPRFLEGRHHGD